MGLGLSLLTSMQPRRAWTTYHRANTLLQLSGIHLHHRKSGQLDSTFWQLFGADRWVSLMIRLQYSIPDNLCDLYIPPWAPESFVISHYRHMAVLTGRVIDCLQSINGQPSPSSIAAIVNQVDELNSHLPPGYLDLTQIRYCNDLKEKQVRIYRLLHVHQLQIYLYLPHFLQNHGGDALEHSRLVCVASARVLLEGFSEMYNADPAGASIDNSISDCVYALTLPRTVEGCREYVFLQCQYA